MTTTKRVTDFRVTWTADHEQYFQGHGIAFTDYTHCAVGVGNTLREAFEDGLEQLADHEGLDYSGWIKPIEKEMLMSLTSQVKKPEMIDWDIVKAECRVKGEHIEYNEDNCAVCAGEWHFYVMIDVKVEGE